MSRNVRAPRLEAVTRHNNAALDAINYIHIREEKKKPFGGPGAPYITDEARWWISWGVRAEGQTCGGSVGGHDPLNLEMALQNHDVLALRVNVPARFGTAASLPL